MASPSEAVDPDRIATLLHRDAVTRGPTLGGGRLVCIDGPAGSGKTTIAEAFLQREPEARLVHMDDLYDGWTGLPTVHHQLATLLEPLAATGAGHYRRYDWHAGAYTEKVEVAPTAWLVLEGVGAGHRYFAAHHTLLAWVTAPTATRRRRWLAREGSEDWWEPWRRGEEQHFARDHTRERADHVVET